MPEKNPSLVENNPHEKPFFVTRDGKDLITELISNTKKGVKEKKERMHLKDAVLDLLVERSFELTENFRGQTNPLLRIEEYRKIIKGYEDDRDLIASVLDDTSIIEDTKKYIQQILQRLDTHIETLKAIRNGLEEENGEKQKKGDVAAVDTAEVEKNSTENEPSPEETATLQTFRTRITNLRALETFENFLLSDLVKEDGLTDTVCEKITTEGFTTIYINKIKRVLAKTNHTYKETLTGSYEKLSAYINKNVDNQDQQIQRVVSVVKAYRQAVNTFAREVDIDLNTQEVVEEAEATTPPNATPDVTPNTTPEEPVTPAPANTDANTTTTAETLPTGNSNDIIGTVDTVVINQDQNTSAEETPEEKAVLDIIENELTDSNAKLVTLDSMTTFFIDKLKNLDPLTDAAVRDIEYNIGDIKENFLEDLSQENANGAGKLKNKIIRHIKDIRGYISSLGDNHDSKTEKIVNILHTYISMLEELQTEALGRVIELQFNDTQKAEKGESIHKNNDEEEQQERVEYDPKQLTDMFELAVFFNDTLARAQISKKETIEDIHTQVRSILNTEFLGIERGGGASENIDRFEKLLISSAETLDAEFGFKDKAGEKLTEQEDSYKVALLNELQTLFISFAEKIQQKKEDLRKGTWKNPKVGKIPKPTTKTKQQKQPPVPNQEAPVPAPVPNQEAPTPAPTQTTSEATPPVKPEVSTKPDVSALLEAMIIDTYDEGLSISAEMKNDTLFNSWIVNIAERSYATGVYVQERTITDWHTEYTNQKGDLDFLKKVLEETKTYESFLGNFPTPEGKEFAKKNYLERTSFDLITYHQETTRNLINSVREHYKKTEELAKKIAQLTKSKDEWETSRQNKTRKISSEMVFEAVGKGNSETVKLASFKSFLEDMSLNYEYYHGKTRDEDSADDYLEMLLLYKQTRDTSSNFYQDRKEKIGGRFKGINRFFRKARTKLFSGSFDQYDDLYAFTRTIESLQKAKVVQTGKVSKEEASVRMRDLKTLVEDLGEKMLYEDSIDQALNKIEDSDLKTTLVNLLNTYVENKAKYSDVQELARKNGATNMAAEKIDRDIATTQQDLERYAKETTYIVDPYFEQETQNLFILQSVEGIIDELRKPPRKGDIAFLNQTSAKLAQLEEQHQKGLRYMNEETLLAYKRASLELAQAYTKIASSRSEQIIAKQSMAYYRKIFDSSESEIPKAKKLEYIQEALKTLRAELPQKRLPLQKLELEKCIKYFENMQKTL